MGRENTMDRPARAPRRLGSDRADGAPGDPAEPEMAFARDPAGEIAAAVRGAMWRDLGVIALRAQAIWQRPPSARPPGYPSPDFGTEALSLARTMSSLALAIKRASGKDVCEAPADTLLVSTAFALDRQFDRAVAHTAPLGIAAPTPGTPEDKEATGRLRHEFERRIMKQWPDMWSDGARADIGLPPAKPRDVLTAEKAHAQFVIDRHQANIDSINAKFAALVEEWEEEENAKTEDRMASPGGGPDAPPPFAPARPR